MREIFLYGELGEKFGKKFSLEVFSAAEAIRALEANFRGKFFQALQVGDYYVVKGSDLDHSEDCLLSEFNFGLGSKDLHIVPAALGAKSGWAQVVVGLAIIGAAVFTGGAAAGLAGISFGAGMGATAMGISMGAYAMFGGALVLGGISTLLTPTMSLPSSGVREAVDPRASFVFQGAENIAAQGGPVPVTYGKFLVGSVVVSASVTVERILDA